MTTPPDTMPDALSIEQCPKSIWLDSVGNGTWAEKEDGAWRLRYDRHDLATAREAALMETIKDFAPFVQDTIDCSEYAHKRNWAKDAIKRHAAILTEVMAQARNAGS